MVRLIGAGAGGTPVHIHLYVKDVDATVARVQAAADDARACTSRARTMAMLLRRA